MLLECSVPVEISYEKAQRLAWAERRCRTIGRSPGPGYHITALIWTLLRFPKLLLIPGYRSSNTAKFLCGNTAQQHDIWKWRRALRSSGEKNWMCCGSWFNYCYFGFDLAPLQKNPKTLLKAGERWRKWCSDAAKRKLSAAANGLTVARSWADRFRTQRPPAFRALSSGQLREWEYAHFSAFLYPHFYALILGDIRDFVFFCTAQTSKFQQNLLHFAIICFRQNYICVFSANGAIFLGGGASLMNICWIFVKTDRKWQILSRCLGSKFAKSDSCENSEKSIRKFSESTFISLICFVFRPTFHDLHSVLLNGSEVRRCGR